MKIDDSFGVLLNDIECSLALSSVNMRELFREKVDNINLSFSTSDSDKSGGNNFRMTSKDIDNLIVYAKNCDNELKTFVEKRKLREKVAKRNLEKSMSYKRKSSFPPIWNDAKLNDYISNIIDEIFLEPEEDPKLESEKTNQSLKGSKAKRNVGTNIKIQGKINEKARKTSKKTPITQMELDKDSIKADVNSSGKISKDIIKLDTGETLFPARGTDEVEKGIFNNLKFKIGSSSLSGSSNVKKSIPTTSRKLNKFENSDSLKCSTTTYTSTTGKHFDRGANSNSNSNYHQHNDVVYVVDNDSMTTKNSANQTNKNNNINIQVLPVLSIKGECRIQSVYKIEILPSTSNGAAHQEGNLNSLSNNIKYCEFIHNDINKIPNENEAHGNKSDNKSSRSTSLDNTIDKIESHIISSEVPHKNGTPSISATASSKSSARTKNQVTSISCPSNYESNNNYNGNPNVNDIIEEQDNNKNKEKGDVIEKENYDNHGIIINARDLNKSLSDHRLFITDEKNNADKNFMEKNSTSIKGSLLKQKPNGFSLNMSNKKVEIDVDENRDGDKEKRNGNGNEKDSSFLSEMSSSITDNIKIKRILKLNDTERSKRNKRGKNYCAIKINYPDSSSSSSSTACESSSYYNHTASETQQQHKNAASNLDYDKENHQKAHKFDPTDSDKINSCNDDFTPIYKLIEDTFQSSGETSPTKYRNNVMDINEKNEQQHKKDDEDYTLKIIKLSEESIKKAGLLLSKYRKKHEENENIITAITASSSPLKKLSTNQMEIVGDRNTSVNAIKSQNQDIIERENNDNIISHNQLDENIFTTLRDLRRVETNNFGGDCVADKTFLEQGVQTDMDHTNRIINDNVYNFSSRYGQHLVREKMKLSEFSGDGKHLSEEFLNSEELAANEISSNYQKVSQPEIKTFSSDEQHPTCCSLHNEKLFTTVSNNKHQPHITTMQHSHPSSNISSNKTDLIKSCDDYQSFTDGLQSNENIQVSQHFKSNRSFSGLKTHGKDLEGNVKRIVSLSLPLQDVARPKDTENDLSIKCCHLHSKHPQKVYEKSIQTDVNLNASQQLYQDIYKTYPHLKNYSKNIQHTSFLEHCRCFGCQRIRKVPPIPAKRTVVSTPFIYPAYNDIPYNSTYSDDESVMKAANKFLRSVEKRKNRNADSDVSSDSSSWEDNLFKKDEKTASTFLSNNTKNAPVVGNLLQFSSSDEENQNLPHSDDDIIKKTSTIVSEIEKKISNITPFEDDILSPMSTDTQHKIPDIENSISYLSDGEVLSQGEIQTGFLMSELK